MFILLLLIHLMAVIVHHTPIPVLHGPDLRNGCGPSNATTTAIAESSVIMSRRGRRDDQPLSSGVEGAGLRHWSLGRLPPSPRLCIMLPQ
jgi:hypothetical protein